MLGSHGCLPQKKVVVREVAPSQQEPTVPRPPQFPKPVPIDESYNLIVSSGSIPVWVDARYLEEGRHSGSVAVSMGGRTRTILVSAEVTPAKPPREVPTITWIQPPPETARSGEIHKLSVRVEGGKYDSVAIRYALDLRYIAADNRARPADSNVIQAYNTSAVFQLDTTKTADDLFEAEVEIPIVCTSPPRIHSAVVLLNEDAAAAYAPVKTQIEGIPPRRMVFADTYSGSALSKMSLQVSGNRSVPISHPLFVKALCGDVKYIMWNARADQSWIELPETNGSRQSDYTEIPLMIRTEGLGRGTHTATLVLDVDQASNRPMTLPVEVSVVDAAPIRWIEKPPEQVEPREYYPVRMSIPPSAILGKAEIYFSPTTDFSEQHDSGSLWRSRTDPATLEGYVSVWDCGSSDSYYVASIEVDGILIQGDPGKISVETPIVPRLSLSSSSLYEGMTVGESPDQEAEMWIGSVCDLPLTWSAVSSLEGVRLSPSEGQMSESNVTASLVVDSLRLGPGNHEGVLSFAVSGSSERKDVPMKIYVAPVLMEWVTAPPSVMAYGDQAFVRVKPLTDHVKSMNLESKGKYNDWRYEGDLVKDLDGSYYGSVQVREGWGYCTPSKARFRAEAHIDVGREGYFDVGRSREVQVDVVPSSESVVGVSPTSLSFTTEAGFQSRVQFVELEAICGEFAEKLSIEADRNWIKIGQPPD